MRPKTIGIIGFDGVTASHLSGAADALATAALDDGFGGRIACYRVQIIGLTKNEFRAESGMAFQPQETLASAPPLDTIIVAGGRGIFSARVYEPVADWILGRAHETRRIASICSGIYAVASTGLLDGREVTTHWRLARDLSRRHPALRINHKRRLAKDGSFYTSAGLTAGVDIALALTEEDYGKQVALALGQELMTYFEAEDQPNDHFGRVDETRPIDRFGDLVAWIMRNLQQNLTVEKMARQACMCPAHFTRAFKSVFGTPPGEFVENLRLNEARRRLSSRGKTVRSVATSVGFRDVETFRRAFERRFGSGPASYLAGLEAVPVSSRPRAGTLVR